MTRLALLALALAAAAVVATAAAQVAPASPAAASSVPATSVPAPSVPAPSVPAPTSPTPSDADSAFFESKVRPLLVERCYKCHSAAAGKDKGGLTVDSAAGLLKGGDTGPSLVPGDPGKSRLIEAVGYKNVDLQMPPKGRLTDAEVADLTEWVRRGAPWPAEKVPAKNGEPSEFASVTAFDLAKRKAEHWAWQPVRLVPAPAVKDAGWATSGVDRFVLAKLEDRGLKPAAPADRRTLVRRASFAITGLPPTPAEVDAFLADGSPDAFAKVVDRLLASPRYGERWARHWLDLVRYAETRGHEFDYDVPNAYQYRDYVIRAFNADVPYDRFVREHVAGDLLPDPRLTPDGVGNESVVATGFWYLGELLHSPVDIRQDEVERVDNQVDVLGKAFLAVTLGCARCHDHKFDAIGTKDFYALAGFLHSSSFRDVRFEHQAHNAAAAGRLRAYDAEAFGKVRAAIDELTRPLFVAHQDFGKVVRAAMGTRQWGDELPEVEQGVVKAWEVELRRALADPRHPLHPLALARWGKSEDAVAAAVAAAKRRRARAGEMAAGGWTTVVDYADAKPGDWIADGHAFGTGPRPAGDLVPGNDPGRPVAAVLPAAAAVGVADSALPGLLRTPTFAISAPTLSMLVRGSGRAFVCIDSHRTVEGPLHGVSKQPIDAGDEWRVQAADLSGYLGQRAHVEFSPGKPGTRLMVGWVRLGAGPARAITPAEALVPDWWATEPPGSADEVVAHLVEKITRSAAALGDGDWRVPESDPAVADWLAARPALLGLTPARTGSLRDAWSAYAAGRDRILADVKPSATAMAILDGSPVDERVLIRGSHKTPGEVVPRRFLEAIDGPAPLAAGAAGSGRLALADRIADPANPLTARVIVNRVWHHLFGRGIVASVDNFGVLGDRPTHPELLDHLADEFVKDGWSVKRLIRRLMLTRAWQMSSHPADAATEQADPQNLLLHRANLRRLEAEAIRDEMLFVSGRLDERMFGPSVPVYLTEFMDGRGRPKESGPLDGAGRRSIYTKVRRNFLPPMMLAFDAPQPFNTMGRRAASNVPAQALILMNDPFVVQQAAAWGRRTLDESGRSATVERRVDAMYRAAFARPATDAEIADALAFLDAQGAELGVDPAKRRDAPKVWADLAHVLMNVKEFVYVP